MLTSAISLCVLLAVGLIGYCRLTGIPLKLQLVIGGAFIVRVMFVVFNNSLRLLTPADESAYDASLRFVSQQWQSGVLHAPLTLSNGPGFDGMFAEIYTFVLGPIYVVFGEYAILGRLGMAFFGTLVVANIYLIGYQLYSHRAGVYATVIAAVFPYWIYLSGILYRDMMVIFFFTMMLYGVVRWQRNTGNYIVLGIAVVSGLFAISLRQVNVIAIGAMVAAIIYTRADQGSQKTLQISAVVIGAGALMIVLFGDTISVEGLAGRRLWLARDLDGAYLTGYAYESFFEMLVFAPIGALYFTFVPFPWQTPNTLAWIALAQNIVLWYPIAILSVVGLRDVLHTPRGQRRLLPVLGFALAGLVGYGLVEGNIGPAMRHRSQFQFVIVIFASVALSKRLRMTISKSRKL